MKKNPIIKNALILTIITLIAGLGHQKPDRTGAGKS